MKDKSNTPVDKPLVRLFNYMSSQTKAKLIITIVLSMIFLGAAVSAEAATVFYVRAGATGNGSGSDWANAYASLPATLVRGATYYVADGTYGSYTFNDPTSGSSLITIMKANVADHGTDTGWNNTYGDGVAQFADIGITTDYHVLDGNSPNGSYGIKVVNGSSGSAIINVNLASNVTIRGVEADCTGCKNIGMKNCLRLYSDGSRDHDFVVENVWTHHCGEDCVRAERVDNVLIDQLYCSNRDNYPGAHGDAFELHSIGNITIRNSRFNWDGQQIFYGGNTSGGNGIGYFYGNVHYSSPSNNSTKGINQHSTATGGPLYVYNNVFYQTVNASLQGGGLPYAAVKNNIFICGASSTVGGSNHDYNAYSSSCTGYSDPHAQIVTSSVFVNPGNGDFELAAATNSGVNLSGGGYNIDPNGNIRGGDNVWDRGAFEFNPSGVAVRPPSAPFNLVIN